MTVTTVQPTITENAMRVLEKRYLNQGESVDQMFMRVADGNADYLKLLQRLWFLPNSPTLMNAGLNNGCTLSACFVFNIGDYMLWHNGKIMEDSIVRTREKAISVAKAGGGVGYYFGDLRPKNSAIQSIHRKACGPVAVLRDYHGIKALVTQGGKRDLAQMGVLPVRHEDILEFIHCKDEDPQSLSSFNISASWQEEQYRRVDHERLWYSPTGPTAASDRYSDVWRNQVESAWHHGCPGILFEDRMNWATHNPNPHLGRILATNPCAETGNRPDEPCNLGSLSLWRFVDLKTRELDWDELEWAARTATRFLDNILDRNVFPHPDITRAALLTRKLGLGLMGWADTLALMGIHYDTQEALDIADQVWGLISQIAVEASVQLASEQGPYGGYSETKTSGECRRNETNTSIAPTGTIALIANASSSIEPHWALEWERTTGEGMKLTERIPVWDYLDGFVPKTANEIHWQWHVKHQATFQAHTDLGVSKTINLPNSATHQDVSDAYKLLHDLECEGGTVFRDGCRSEQVLVKKSKGDVFTTGLSDRLAARLRVLTEQQQEQVLSILDIGVLNSATVQPTPSLQRTKRKMPRVRDSITHKFLVSGTECFMTVGLYEDHTPGEVFLRASRLGSTIGGMMDTWAINFSVALQSGVPLPEICHHHLGNRFEPCGLTDNEDLPMCTSIPDYVCRWLLARFPVRVSPNTVSAPSQDTDSGMYCPDCGKEAVYRDGCLKCIDGTCAWSRCG